MSIKKNIIHLVLRNLWFRFDRVDRLRYCFVIGPERDHSYDLRSDSKGLFVILLLNTSLIKPLILSMGIKNSDFQQNSNKMVIDFSQQAKELRRLIT